MERCLFLGSFFSHNDFFHSDIFFNDLLEANKTSVACLVGSGLNSNFR